MKDFADLRFGQAKFFKRALQGDLRSTRTLREIAQFPESGLWQDAQGRKIVRLSKKKSANFLSLQTDFPKL